MKKVLAISGSVFGTKTRIALDTLKPLFSSDVDFEVVDLKEIEVAFSDGRDYRDYEGDTLHLVEKILAADALVIGSPVFQASIPGALKNIFDLIPIDGLKDKVVGIVMTAGSSKHYMVGEYQLKPILSYMKARTVAKYVFIEGKDFYRTEIIEDDVHFRLKRLARNIEEDMLLTDTLKAERNKLFSF
ncbi:NAD(P)H-dependent oxidoreductase [Erysipelothrix sp. HDW6C]|uniref:NADPH-dependent FMN reductase n=1 Tax=Erysipelothrix sp. HDW6C TaxID=2714930 RepID=UPI00140CA37C|nr:NADPH-dependent FMN reductase [Erysipelothrix sp. HDW6C]QIK70733.1 NAD(P)H-dependent oxidoreductase [Erysipelothrix sp. HDW6C]